jgi:hypothetical protein
MNVTRAMYHVDVVLTAPSAQQRRNLVPTHTRRGRGNQESLPHQATNIHRHASCSPRIAAAFVSAAPVTRLYHWIETRDLHDREWDQYSALNSFSIRGGLPVTHMIETPSTVPSLNYVSAMPLSLLTCLRLVRYSSPEMPASANLGR